MPQPRSHASNADRQAAYRRRAKEALALQLTRKGLPPLPVIPAMPGEQRWKKAIEHANFLMETTHEEMLRYYEERSQNWQEGERGEAHQERVQILEAVLDSLKELLD